MLENFPAELFEESTGNIKDNSKSGSRNYDKDGNPIKSKVIYDEDEEFVMRTFELVGIGIIAFLAFMVVCCLCCRKNIKDPAVSERSVLLRSFVASEV